MRTRGPRVERTLPRPGPARAVGTWWPTPDPAASLVLSPHLDDAVLSCGGLLDAHPAGPRATVVTVFTDAAPPPWTWAARSFLRASGFADAESLYDARRREDLQVLAQLGVDGRHLGQPDALFRRRVLPGPGESAAARTGEPHPRRPWPAELAHRYPTYRFDIALGRIARADHRLADSLAEQVLELLQQTGSRLLLAPLGVGRHVDHLLVRQAGLVAAERSGTPIAFYSDFPYHLSARPDPAFVAGHDLRPVAVHVRGTRKEALVRGYRTQVSGLFPAGEIPAVPELFWLPR